MSRVSIAHLSDPHFGTVYPVVQTALLTSLREERPDIVLVSGDITQRARRHQFVAAREFRESLRGTRFFAVPGNHDIPLFDVFGRLFRPYHGFHRYFQNEREAELRADAVRMLGLNSTSRWRHIQGRLDLDRIRDAMLRSWGDAKVRVVMVHHPLACARAADIEENRLRDLEATEALFREAKVDLVLSGHVHDPFVGVHGSFVVSTAGTCLSWRTRSDAPNSYHRIDIETEPREIVIERRELADGRFRAVPESRRAFRAGESGWVSNSSSVAKPGSYS